GVSVYYVFFYLLIAVVAFVLPPLIGDQRAVAMSIYVAVYLLGTVEVILKAMPTVTRASFAVDELYEFERRLEAAARDEWEAADAADFSRISARDLLYSYRDAQGATSFTMGPTSLDIAKGELLFVVGGNG